MAVTRKHKYLLQANIHESMSLHPITSTECNSLYCTVVCCTLYTQHYHKI